MESGRKKRAVRRAAIGVAVAAGAFAAVASVTPLINLAPFARPIEVAMSDALGRQVIISGAVHLSLVPSLALKMEGVFVANAEGGASRYFLLADGLAAELGVSVLPRPVFTVNELRLDGLSVNLETSPKGEASWQLRAAKPTLDIGLPIDLELVPRQIVVTNFRLGDPGPGGEISPRVIGRAILVRPLHGSDMVRVFAQTSNGPWQIDARIANLPALLSAAPVQLAGELTGPTTTASLKGGRESRGGALTLEAQGQSGDFSALERLAGLAGGRDGVPAKFTLSFKSQAQAGTLHVDFPALGAGDLALEANYKHAPGLQLTGKITSHRLDLRAFIPRFAPPKAGPLFSDVPIDAGAWRALQAAFTLDAEQLTWGEDLIGAGRARLWADHGIVSLGPVTVLGSSASFSGDATFDTRAEPRLAVTVHASISSIGALLKSGEHSAIDGHIDAALELAGTGRSPAALMASAAGQTNLLLGPGRLAPALAKSVPNELAFGRTTAGAPADVNPEDPGAARVAHAGLEIGCFVSRFDIESGKAVSRALLLVTAEAITTGDGEIDLARELVDLHLRPRPKNPALISEAQDLDVSGPLREPKWTPAAGTVRRGLVRAGGQMAAGDGFAGFMPLLDAQAGLANPCVKSWMQESLPTRQVAKASDMTR